MKIKSFTFNPFQENTLIIYDNSKECMIVDPGFYEEKEQIEFLSFIIDNKLTPTKLINTHCHIDHILGNNFIINQWGLNITLHKNELKVLEYATGVASVYGFNNYIHPNKENSLTLIEEHEKISFGNTEFDILFVPGHSPGHICLYNKEQNTLISGDVIFQNSIGRTDLPGGDHELLINSIFKNILPLPEQTLIYPGHGPATNLKFEKENNPFLQKEI